MESAGTGMRRQCLGCLRGSHSVAYREALRLSSHLESPMSDPSEGFGGQKGKLEEKKKDIDNWLVRDNSFFPTTPRFLHIYILHSPVKLPRNPSENNACLVIFRSLFCKFLLSLLKRQLGTQDWGILNEWR